MRSLPLAAILLSTLTLASACRDDRGGPPMTGVDAGPGVDGGTVIPPIIPPAGGVAVAVDSAGWVSSTALVVRARAGNAAGGAPAAVGFPTFSVETNRGALVTSNGTLDSSPNACPVELSLTGGATRTCDLSFTLPAGETPVRLHYAPDGDRTANAAIVTCSAAAPGGLCSGPSELCVSGVCQAACSSEAPAGVCPGDERCDGGDCVPPCSASAPRGWCAEGACVGGACDTTCRELDSESSECINCIGLNYEACVPGEGLCPGQADCEECVFSESSTCACGVECASCQEELDEGISCLLSVCPVCG